MPMVCRRARSPRSAQAATSGSGQSTCWRACSKVARASSPQQPQQFAVKQEFPQQQPQFGHQQQPFAQQQFHPQQQQMQLPQQPHFQQPIMHPHQMMMQQLQPMQYQQQMHQQQQDVHMAPAEETLLVGGQAVPVSQLSQELLEQMSEDEFAVSQNKTLPLYCVLCVTATGSAFFPDSRSHSLDLCITRVLQAYSRWAEQQG